MRKELVEQAVKFLMNYASNVVSKVLPEAPEEKELKLIKNTTLVAYSAAVGFGQDIVESTENTYDDKAIKELLESCEETAEKYNFSLNPKDWR
jgi:hypothetical protein